MSDNIPFDIQAKIMKLLPVRSLITFWSVCKAWKSHIDGSDFVRCYRSRHLQQHEDLVDFERKYVLIADDDNFPRNKVSLTIPILLRNPRVIDSSHGLLCLLGDFDEENEKVVIWNLSIRKAVAVVVPGPVQGAVLGFGVCRENNDPKIVRLTRAGTWQVEIFTLSTGSWRSPCKATRTPHAGKGIAPATSPVFTPEENLAPEGVVSRGLAPEKESHLNAKYLARREVFLHFHAAGGGFPAPTGAKRGFTPGFAGHYTRPNTLLRESILFSNLPQVVVVLDGFLYLLAYDQIIVDGESEGCNLIISFDMTSEEFEEVNLPTSLTHVFFYYLRLSKLRESLVLLHYDVDPNNGVCVCGVWRLEDGDPKAFSKLFNVSDNASPDLLVKPVGFRKTGEAIVEYMNNSGRLFGYEPHSKRIINLGINGRGLCHVCPYMETLLLLDKPNLTV